MRKTAGELSEFLGGRLEGRAAESIEGLADLERARSGDLSYAETRLLDKVGQSQASCVLVSEGAFPDKTTIHVANPKAAFARAAAWLRPPRRPAPQIHATAVIAAWFTCSVCCHHYN